MPTTPGTYELRLFANNSYTLLATSPHIVTTLQITTTSLPNGLWGGSYAASLAATGGTKPYTWTIVGGTLPPGLSLALDTGAITGTPSAEGSWNFTAQATDAATPLQSATAQLSIAVPAAEITNATGGSCSSGSPCESLFAYQLQSYLGESGNVMPSLNNTYSYSPSVIYNSATGDTLMWFCSADTSGSHPQGDAIWFSHSTGFGATSASSSTWSTPVEVIRSSYSAFSPPHYDYLDAWHTCDPSVVMADNYYYIAYTGATNWTQGPGHQYSSVCGSGNEGNCDNRIFLARVPVGQEGQQSSYQKLVDVGKCADSSCFQFEPVWGSATAYPPVPIVKFEVGPVWRQAGTGTTGTTTPQTSSYGIGEPSLLNDGAVRIFFSRVFSSSDQSEGVWQRPASDFLNGYAMQDYSTYYQRVADRGNDVDYDVAFDTAQNRYLAAIGKGGSESPRVMYAQTTGSGVTLPPGIDPTLPGCSPVPACWTMTPDLCLGSASGEPPNPRYEIISYNLGRQPQAVLQNAEPQSHNVALLRDIYGNLVASPGQSGDRCTTGCTTPTTATRWWPQRTVAPRSAASHSPWRRWGSLIEEYRWGLASLPGCERG